MKISPAHECCSAYRPQGVSIAPFHVKPSLGEIDWWVIEPERARLDIIAGPTDEENSVDTRI